MAGTRRLARVVTIALRIPGGAPCGPRPEQRLNVRPGRPRLGAHIHRRAEEALPGADRNRGMLGNSPRAQRASARRCRSGRSS